MPLAPGSLLQGGKYRIIRFISSGGFGCTYEAVHTGLNGRMAIKEFFVQDICNRDDVTGRVSVGLQSKAQTFDKLREKFIREAQSVFALSHPGIVHVSDVFEENGTAYFVMDYIDGCSLADLVDKNGPMDEATALGYMRQVCAALDYVHANGRLHLDIKPGNIMVDRAGRAVLIDFGASKQYDSGTGENLSTLLGFTPGFAPPEQMTADVSRFLPATDVYALGGTLYNLLTGEAPLSANHRYAGDELKPLPESVSPSTRRAVEAALQLNKSARPQSVAEFSALLFDDKAPQPQPKPTPGPAPRPGNPTVKIDSNPHRPWYRRYAALLTAAAVLAVGITAAVLFVGRSSSPGGEAVVSDTLASLGNEIEDIVKVQSEITASEAPTDKNELVTKNEPVNNNEPATKKGADVDNVKKTYGHSKYKNLDLATTLDGKPVFFTLSEWNAVPSAERSRYKKVGVVIDYGGCPAFTLALHDNGKAITWDEAVSKYGESRLPSKTQCRAMGDQYESVNKAITAFGGDKDPGHMYWGKSLDSGSAWGVGMYYGGVPAELKLSENRVRAVAPVPNSTSTRPRHSVPNSSRRGQDVTMNKTQVQGTNKSDDPQPKSAD